MFPQQPPAGYSPPLAISTTRDAGGTVLDQPELYDRITLAGVRAPGLATVSGGARAFEWESKKSPGTEGSTDVFKGRKPATAISVVLQFWEPEHHHAWRAFSRMLQDSVAGSTPTALDVEHPDLNANGIVSVSVNEIGQPEHDTGGISRVTFTLREYAPAKPKTPAGASGSKGTSGGKDGSHPDEEFGADGKDGYGLTKQDYEDEGLYFPDDDGDYDEVDHVVDDLEGYAEDAADAAVDFIDDVTGAGNGGEESDW